MILIMVIYFLIIVAFLELQVHMGSTITYAIHNLTELAV